MEKTSGYPAGDANQVRLARKHLYPPRPRKFGKVHRATMANLAHGVVISRHARNLRQYPAQVDHYIVHLTGVSRPSHLFQRVGVLKAEFGDCRPPEGG
jgi:hypothetical protein